ncbi:SigE family RNA polymerase sigma factor [Nocardioides caeni]|uniref:SigE family RNA polymerase sigma factor n=1 Tax=Nocardioides caeni TaxID=574700 RepID=A0A4S8N0K1_9ACTN|nr:SigE family RNA polymerase sigma factor [Nocardioides caeni]THV08981.1 SigE family RNA polymerase sigma factor [Nocardioides caeni]
MTSRPSRSAPGHGPEEEFSALVEAAWPSLYRTAYLLTGDHGMAEDLTQTALAATFARWHRLHDTGAAWGYARKAVVNGATSWFRRSSTRSERPTAVIPERAAATDHGREVGERSAVVGALAQLPPRQRAVVVLRFYDDLSVQDTAATLGISTGTVKSQTSDALARLRGLLGEDLADTTATASNASNALGGHHG